LCMINFYYVYCKSENIKFGKRKIMYTFITKITNVVKYLHSKKCMQDDILHLYIYAVSQAISS
jgi:hypothetical protein